LFLSIMKPDYNGYLAIVMLKAPTTTSDVNPIHKSARTLISHHQYREKRALVLAKTSSKPLPVVPVTVSHSNS
jgi:hypothetical protein